MAPNGSSKFSAGPQGARATGDELACGFVSGRAEELRLMAARKTHGESGTTAVHDDKAESSGHLEKPGSTCSTKVLPTVRYDFYPWHSSDKLRDLITDLPRLLDSAGLKELSGNFSERFGMCQNAPAQPPRTTTDGKPNAYLHMRADVGYYPPLESADVDVKTRDSGCTTTASRENEDARRQSYDYPVHLCESADYQGVLARVEDVCTELNGIWVEPMIEGGRTGRLGVHLDSDLRVLRCNGDHMLGSDINADRPDVGVYCGHPLSTMQLVLARPENLVLLREGTGPLCGAAQDASKTSTSKSTTAQNKKEKTNNDKKTGGTPSENRGQKKQGSGGKNTGSGSNTQNGAKKSTADKDNSSAPGPTSASAGVAATTRIDPINPQPQKKTSPAPQNPKNGKTSRKDSPEKVSLFKAIEERCSALTATPGSSACSSVSSPDKADEILREEDEDQEEQNPSFPTREDGVRLLPTLLRDIYRLMYNKIPASPPATVASSSTKPTGSKDSVDSTKSTTVTSSSPPPNKPIERRQFLTNLTRYMFGTQIGYRDGPASKTAENKIAEKDKEGKGTNKKNLDAWWKKPMKCSLCGIPHPINENCPSDGLMRAIADNYDLLGQMNTAMTNWTDVMPIMLHKVSAATETNPAHRNLFNWALGYDRELVEYFNSQGQEHLNAGKILKDAKPDFSAALHKGDRTAKGQSKKMKAKATEDDPDIPVKVFTKAEAKKFLLWYLLQVHSLPQEMGKEGKQKIDKMVRLQTENCEDHEGRLELIDWDFQMRVCPIVEEALFSGRGTELFPSGFLTNNRKKGTVAQKQGNQNKKSDGTSSTSTARKTEDEGTKLAKSAEIIHLGFGGKVKNSPEEARLKHEFEYVFHRNEELFCEAYPNCFRWSCCGQIFRSETERPHIAPFMYLMQQECLPPESLPIAGLENCAASLWLDHSGVPGKTTSTEDTSSNKYMIQKHPAVQKFFHQVPYLSYLVREFVSPLMHGQPRSTLASKQAGAPKKTRDQAVLSSLPGMDAFATPTPQSQFDKAYHSLYMTPGMSPQQWQALVGIDLPMHTVPDAGKEHIADFVSAVAKLPQGCTGPPPPPATIAVKDEAAEEESAEEEQETEVAGGDSVSESIKVLGAYPVSLEEMKNLSKGWERVSKTCTQQ
ncbi:unnamed protein product [Amoebophrya sp. A120]|nr:unnamed protein product [Amoebophrya sp. A120]|eukprot:GSA120T00004086001.1